MQEIKTGTDHTNSIARNLNFLKKYSVIMQNMPASTKPSEIIYMTLIFLADRLYIAFIAARYINAAMKSIIMHLRKVFFLIIMGVIAQHHAKRIDGMA